MFRKNRFRKRFSRDEYYTDWHEKNEQNRQKMYGRRYGIRYNPNLEDKEISKIIKKYIKENYPEFKFSVRKSKGNAIQIYLTDAPQNVQVYSDVFLQTHLPNAPEPWHILKWKYDKGEIVLNKYHINGKYKMTEYNPQINAMLKDIDNFGRSFMYDGSDSMIDYFDVNFYVFTDVYWEFKQDRLEYELERFT
jgi:hypothetical protein